ncbi:hypothetical protein [Xenorhabdus szentirmaii]|uniref:Late promoter activating protein n=1 Tax=Xenorhabdus szentirmaii DSM 16338 TaxID=1427518 RepID=W1J7D4_9GAMM|nr:hypothetical protein [Xenorhabdus szentirmaii]PHM30300.1 hypothetical protein Xsze_04344 [Xenorhabdus szentirmaii DSM 16338]CDL85776.1 hypothetical protein XSR1_920005 [Xenorhabdus szentirmaii DSM 16338]
MHEKEKISNIHLANVLLRENRPLTAKEVMDAIRHYYPHVEIDKDFVYARLNVFCSSKNIICIMDTRVRPRTFEMKYITQVHFKPSNGTFIDFSKTVIPAGGVKGDEKKAARNAALLREIWDDIIRKRTANTIS